MPGCYVRVAHREGAWVRLHASEGFRKTPAWMPVHALEKQEIQIWRVVRRVIVRQDPSVLGTHLGVKPPGSKLRVAYCNGPWACIHSKAHAWVLTEKDGKPLLEYEGTEAEASLPAFDGALDPPAGVVRECGVAKVLAKEVQSDEGKSSSSSSSSSLTVQEKALPPALARELRDRLVKLPAEAWQLMVTEDQPVGPGAKKIPMRFHRLEGKWTMEGEMLKRHVEDDLRKALSPRPQERLFVNFSKYEEGDFLAPHTDTPSGNPSYERRSAFILYLTENWVEADGGLFIDEEAEGGPRPIVPSFNALVSFQVPRRHSVTKVTAASKARFAVYGWVVEPHLERIGSTPELMKLFQSTQRKAVAVAFTRASCTDSVALSATIAGLAVEDVCQHNLGELCVFAATHSKGVAAALGIPKGSAVALAVVAKPASYKQDGEGSHVVSDDELHRLMQHEGDLLRFVNVARTVFSPCGELDYRDALLMSDLSCSHELKVFLFIPPPLREAQLLRRLDAWAAALQPKSLDQGLRLLLADSERNRPVLEDFGLTVADVPTAVAEDTVRNAGTFRFKDESRRQGPGLDLDELRQWLVRLAKVAGISKPHLE